MHGNEHIRVTTQYSYLKTFPDIEKLYSKFYRVHAKVRHSAQLIDCIKVYNMIHSLNSMCAFLKENIMEFDNDAVKSSILDPLIDASEEFMKCKTMLEECIDIEKSR